MTKKNSKRVSIAVKLAISRILRSKNLPAKYRHKIEFNFFLISLNLFRQEIKMLFLLIAYQQSLGSGQKSADFRNF